MTSPVKVDLQSESALESARCQVDQPLRRRFPNHESIPVGHHDRGNRALKTCPSCQCHPWKVISHPDRYMTIFIVESEAAFHPATAS
jgi:hypothetical protein